MAEREDLIGIYEIAEMAGVTRAAVANWRKRFRDFPPPAAELRSGPVFRRAHVRRWLGKRRGGVARVIAMLNLKRGAGASTAAVALAEVLAADFRQRVLLIDLDPQTSSTVMLTGPERWKKLNSRGKTLVRLFEHALEWKKGRRPLKPDALIVRGASRVEQAPTLDLVPSSLDLLEVQERWLRAPAGPHHLADPTALLRGALGDRLDEYDTVIIDCPPDLGLVTLNGLRMATGYIVPVTPDPMTTYGLKRIATRIAAFSAEICETIEPLGVLLNRFDEADPGHAKLRKKLGKGPIAAFETVIPESPGTMAEAARGPFPTTEDRYGDTPLYRAWLDLAEELQATLEPTSRQVEEPPPAADPEEEQDHDDD